MTHHQLQTQLERLFDCAEQLWRDYLQQGPGALAANDFGPVGEAIQQTHLLLERTPASSLPAGWSTSWRQVAHELGSLLKRAVERSEGLCFVTGEAGLIPRRDLYARCEAALLELQRLQASLAEAER